MSERAYQAALGAIIAVIVLLAVLWLLGLAVSSPASAEGARPTWTPLAPWTEMEFAWDPWPSPEPETPRPPLATVTPWPALEALFVRMPGPWPTREPTLPWREPPDEEWIALCTGGGGAHAEQGAD